MELDLPRDVATLLEQCAQRRAGMPAATADGARDAAHAARMLQAETAGRELMAALVRPVPFADRSVAATLRLLLGYVQTVVSASTPDDALEPHLTVRVRAISVPPTTALLLYTVALSLVLAALDDDATEVDIRLDVSPTQLCITVECDRSGLVDETATRESLHAAVRHAGGQWTAQAAAHGRSWLVVVALPHAAHMLIQEVPYDQ